MKIHIARNGQQLGPFDEEQLTEQLEQGTVSYDDLAWVEGMSEWLPLRQITSGSTEVPHPEPLSIASPSVAAAAPTEAMASTPKLWNPKAAALWSILFTSVLGSFLHWRNALALGRAEEAAANLKWFYVGLIGWVMYMLRDHCTAYPVLHLLMSGAWIVLLVVWYFTTGKRQVGFVKENFPTGYAKKGWLKPIGVMLATIICLVLADVAIPEPAEKHDTPQTKQEGSNQAPKEVEQKEEIQKQVKDLLARDLATDKDYKDFGLKVKDVILVKETEKKYTGYAVVQYRGQDHKASITVKTDGDTIMYEMEPLDFVPGKESEEDKQASSDIQNVKDGVMFFDKSTTIGKAFAGYPFFKSVTWSEQKLSSGGKRVVVEGIADWDKIKPVDYARAMVKAGLSPEELLNSSEDMKDAERALNDGRTSLQKMVASYVLRFVFSIGMDDSIKLQDVQLILTKPSGEKAQKSFNDNKLEKHTLQQIFEGGVTDVMLLDIVQAESVEKAK